MDEIQEDNQVVNTDGASATTAANGLDAFSDTVDDTDDTSEDGMVKKLKRELQCTVCDQIPTSIPIPSCPMGHILCKECKEKIVYSRLIRDLTSLVLSAEVLLIGTPATWPAHSSPSSQTFPVPTRTVGVTSKGLWMI